MDTYKERMAKILKAIIYYEHNGEMKETVYYGNRLNILFKKINKRFRKEKVGWVHSIIIHKFNN